ncbi:MAG: KpsF/GutQ family sugar-phosphate isomerase, partial [Rhodospirillales bacterium]
MSPPTAPKRSGRRSAYSPEAETGLESAKRVLNIEAEALLALSAGLGEALISTLDMLAGVSGRVVVTGMGKSGHVGRKIAATLASTGTP